MNKKSLEALDRTMKDLRNNQNRFVRAMILLAGDFRQTLPVILTGKSIENIILGKSRHRWEDTFYNIS